MDRFQKTLLVYIAVCLVCMTAGMVTMNFTWFRLQGLATVVFVVVLLARKYCSKKTVGKINNGVSNKPDGEPPEDN